MIKRRWQRKRVKVWSVSIDAIEREPENPGVTLCTAHIRDGHSCFYFFVMNKRTIFFISQCFLELDRGTKNLTITDTRTNNLYIQTRHKQYLYSILKPIAFTTINIELFTTNEFLLYPSLYLYLVA